jgi:hypothetical protein
MFVEKFIYARGSATIFVFLQLRSPMNVNHAKSSGTSPNGISSESPTALNASGPNSTENIPSHIIKAIVAHIA